MRIDKKLLVPIAMLSIVTIGGAYAFLSLTVTTTLNISDPLSIVAVTGTDALADITCTTTAATATCSADASAGESGRINVMVANGGLNGILVTASSTSSSTDVEVAGPTPAGVPAGGTFEFVFDVSILEGATPGPVTLTLNFER